VLYEKGTEPQPMNNHHYPVILPDMPDFVSPIDGKLYSGRAGMREHNKRHDVVSNLDLKGLPTLTNISDLRDSSTIKRDREARLEIIRNQVNKHVR
jgi:hypothetical protein